MIARIWRGATRPEDADRYIAHVEATGVQDYRATPGSLGVHILRNDLDDRTEIVTLAFRESWEAIQALAGDDPGVTRFYPEDDGFLLEGAERVEHYTVPYSSLFAGATG